MIKLKFPLEFDPSHRDSSLVRLSLVLRQLLKCLGWVPRVLWLSLVFRQIFLSAPAKLLGSCLTAQAELPKRSSQVAQALRLSLVLGPSLVLGLSLVLGQLPQCLGRVAEALRLS